MNEEYEKGYDRGVLDTVEECQRLDQLLTSLCETYQQVVDELMSEKMDLEHNWNELKKWLIEQEQRAWDEVSSTFGYVLDKMAELEEGGNND